MALSQFRAPVVEKPKDQEEDKDKNENKFRSAKEQREMKE
jgi:hypothetical protein